MQVIATRRGYFGQLREEGERFCVPDTAKSRWFVALDEAASQAALLPLLPQQELLAEQADKKRGKPLKTPAA